jgi:flagellar hook-associated protein 2
MTNSVGSSGSGSSGTGSTTNTPPLTAAQILAQAQANAQAAAQTIISGSGIGSGMNLQQLMSGLMSVESVPLLQLQAQQAGVQSTVSAFGTLSSAFATFEDSLSDLTFASNFQTLAAASSDETVASVALNTGAVAGTYDINVTKLAASESLLAPGQTSTSISIGSGSTSTLNITLGTTTPAVPASAGPPPVAAVPASFTPNSGQTVVPIKIDSSNNTLQGIAQAINSASVGVTASIVNDGSGTPYRLQLTSTATGATQAISVNVAGAGGTGAGDPALTSMLQYDPAGTQNMTETTAASNAALTVNGTPIQSPSNTVDGAFPGLAIGLVGTGDTTITVGNATSGLATLVQNFVTAYNAMQNAIQPLTVFNASDSAQSGPLLGDGTTQQLMSQIQSIVSSVVAGMPQDMSGLSDIGITLDPTNPADNLLALDSTTLSAALAKSPTALQGLFATQTTATDPLVTALANANSSPQSGTYAITVSQAATQGSLTGSTPATLPPDTDAGATAGETAATQLSLNLNGTFASITVPAGNYATLADYATALQGSINGNSTFSAQGFSANVVANSDGTLSVTSTQYGSSSNIEITGTDAAALFGQSSNVGTAGVDIAGSIGGQPATGSGQTLTAEGTGPASGLAVTVQGSLTGSRGSVSYSSGIATQLMAVMTQAVQVDGAAGATSDGSITSAISTLQTQITAIEAQETQTQSYIDSVSANYQTEFTQLQTTLASMASVKSYLQQLFNPSTSS